VRRHRDWYKLASVVAERRDLTGGDKVLYAVLADHVGDNRQAWPGVRTLAAEAGFSHLGTVAESLRRLVAAGLVTVTSRGRGRSNLYAVAVPETGTPPQEPSAPETSTVDDGASAQKIGTPKPSECTENRNGGVPKTGAQVFRFTEPNKKRETEKRGAAAPTDQPGRLTLTAHGGNGAGRIMAAWCDGHQVRRGRPLPGGSKGRVSGTLKRMLRDHAAADLTVFIGRWFGQDRPSYAVGLFERKVQDGDADVVGRTCKGPPPGQPARVLAELAAAGAGA
jgi:hypothetical protein